MTTQKEKKFLIKSKIRAEGNRAEIFRKKGSLYSKLNKDDMWNLGFWYGIKVLSDDLLHGTIE